jgi:hypothetical protein
MAKIILSDGYEVNVKENYEECLYKIKNNYYPKEIFLEFTLLDNWNIDIENKCTIMISKIIMIQI